jgi:hypothetical protein
MSLRLSRVRGVIPAQAGIQNVREPHIVWVPAWMGTNLDSRSRGNKPGFLLAQE